MDPVFKSPPHAMHQVMQQRFAIHAIWFIAIPPYVLDLERNRHSFAMVRQITKMNFSINFVIFSNLRHHVTYRISIYQNQRHVHFLNIPSVPTSTQFDSVVVFEFIAVRLHFLGVELYIQAASRWQIDYPPCLSLKIYS